MSSAPQIPVDNGTVGAYTGVERPGHAFADGSTALLDRRSSRPTTLACSNTQKQFDLKEEPRELASTDSPPPREASSRSPALSPAGREPALSESEERSDEEDRMGIWRVGLRSPRC